MPGQKASEPRDPIMGEGEDLDLEKKDPIMGEGEEIGEEEAGEAEGSEEGEEAGKESKLQVLLKKRGLKSEDDLVDLLEKQERRITELGKTSRINSLIPARPAVMPERREPTPIDVPDDLYEIITDKEKSKKYINDLAASIRRQTRAEIEEEEAARTYDRMRKEAIELVREDPDKFVRLRPLMIQIANEDPGLGLRELYAEADQRAKADREVQAKELMAGMGIDPNDLRHLVAKKRPAEISTASGGGAASSRVNLTDRQKVEEQIKKNILGANRLDT